jgi:hypothetical protein
MIADGVLVVYDEFVPDVVDGVDQSHPQDVTEELIGGAARRCHTGQHVDLR